MEKETAPIHATSQLTIWDCHMLYVLYKIPSPVSGTLTSWVHQTTPEKLTSVATGKLA